MNKLVFIIMLFSINIKCETFKVVFFNETNIPDKDLRLKLVNYEHTICYLEFVSQALYEIPKSICDFYYIVSITKGDHSLAYSTKILIKYNSAVVILKNYNNPKQIIEVMSWTEHHKRTFFNRIGYEVHQTSSLSKKKTTKNQYL